MTYRLSADLLEHMFPVDAGIDPRTLRRHTMKAAAALADPCRDQASGSGAGDHGHRGFHLRQEPRGRRKSV